MEFNSMSLRDSTKDAVAAMGYHEATPIQRDAIQHLLDGRDVIGKAQTGTGKTGAFGIPIFDNLRHSRRDAVVGLVLVPTRELALQVTEVLTALARGSDLAVVPIFGGTGFGKQIDAMGRRGAKVVVACPGRLLDLENRGDIDLSHVEELVLDEADRMLDMGFIHDMRKILALLPRDRRTSLWSATISPDIKRLAKDFLRDPVTVEVESESAATMLTEQFHLKVEKPRKTDTLLSLLHAELPHKAVVFTRTKHLAKRLSKQLDNKGWASVALQGNMTQGQRERSMAAFRDGKARILVATDVAARGLDVPDISHVVNFDLPNEPEQYVHRVGRTGRNGKTGRSVSFVQSDQHNDWKIIQRTAGLQVPHWDTAFEDDAPNGPDEPFQATLAPQRQGRPKHGTPRRRHGGGQGRQHSQGGRGGQGSRSGGGQGSRGPRRRHYGGRQQGRRSNRS